MTQTTAEQTPSASFADLPDTESDFSSFSSLGLSSTLCKALTQVGYRRPTPIQVQGIPPLLAGRDLLGCAQTGSGKTAAFTLPILHQLMIAPHHKGLRALILAPTRELATQIGDCFQQYAKGSALRCSVVFGGVSRHGQLRTLRARPDVLIACPGRLLDLMQTEGVDLSRVRHLVLDEADRMLDMGFVHDVRRIAASLPRERQTVMFSATMPKAIAALAKSLLRDPARVSVDPVSSTAPPIAQSVYFVPSKQKQALLTHLLQEQHHASQANRTLVFTRTKHGANRVAERLGRVGITAAAIHGNKSQGARQRTLEGFRRGNLRVVVATDLASRGIDVKELSHVVNYDLPNVPETYVHRIGRTGRAGAEGTAISLCSNDERPHLRSIENLIGQSVARASLEGVTLPELAAMPQDSEPVQRLDRRAVAPRRSQPRQNEQTSPQGRRFRPRRQDSARGIKSRQA